MSMHILRRLKRNTKKTNQNFWDFIIYKESDQIILKQHKLEEKLLNCKILNKEKVYV